MSNRSLRHIWLIAGVIAGSASIALVFAETDVITSAAGGPGGHPFTIDCLPGQILVGVRLSAGWFVQSLAGVCSEFIADGTVKDHDSTFRSRTTKVGNQYADPEQEHEVMCPSNQALVRISGKAGNLIDQLFISCAPLGLDGRRRSEPELVTTESFSISGGGDPFVRTCPDSKVAHSFTGAIGTWLDRVALVCSGAPPWATGVQSVTLSPPAVTSGTPVAGTATINGLHGLPVFIALGRPNGSSVLRGVTNVPGTSVPESVALDLDVLSVPFRLSSTSAAVGCVSVAGIALDIFGRMFPPARISNEVILSPPPMRGLAFQFNLVDQPASLTYVAPRSITARISFRRRSLPFVAGSSGTVTFSSSKPTVVSVPASVSYNAISFGVDVQFSALNAGCTVITATRDGISIRRAIRTVLAGG